MKINEVTEGLGQAFAASLARAVGADQAAGTIEKGRSGDSIFKFSGELNLPPDTGFFQNPTKITKLIDILSRIAVQNKKAISKDQVEQLIAKNQPQAWTKEQNKPGVLDGIMKALTSKGINTNPIAKPAMAPDQAAASASDMAALRAKLQARKAQFQRR